MLFKYEIYDNNGWLYNLKTKEYQVTKLPKLFNGDILNDKFKIVESPVRESKSLIGIFSTSQTQRFGKNKRGNTIFLVSPLDNKLPSFLISYGGKLKGKLAVKFKFTHWEHKLPSGEIIEVIGNYNEENMIPILMNHYNVFPKRIKSRDLIKNPLEEKINRKKYNSVIFSIDPDNCEDIDDALSIEYDNDIIIIGVHIAQPICWISAEEIYTKMKTQISTLYLDRSRKDLWGETITRESSLFEGQEKPAYTILYHYQDNNLIKVEDFPSLIVNNKNLSYDNAFNFANAEKLKNFTKILTSINDYHELVSYWMVLTNKIIGEKFNREGKQIPYRVNSEHMSLEDYNLKSLSDEIKKKFLTKKIEAASYSLESNRHETLGIDNYCHFTSPIRRIIDTYIHYYLTYCFDNIIFDFDFDCDLINFLDKQTKKFHRELELNKSISVIFGNTHALEKTGYIYQFISNNCVEVYIPPIDGFELGFVKVKLYHYKFDYLISKERINNKLILSNTTQPEHIIEYSIGQKVKLKIHKLESVLPKNKLLISLDNEFTLINI
jgi:exoribonuclease R